MNQRFLECVESVQSGGDGGWAICILYMKILHSRLIELLLHHDLPIPHTHTHAHTHTHTHTYTHTPTYTHTLSLSNKAVLRSVFILASPQALLFPERQSLILGLFAQVVVINQNVQYLHLAP